ncbi:MAG: ribbon-helix-helix protein, CopG family [Terracidiphilus sp.]
METIRVVLDKKLLLVADRAARRMNASRSALVRDALRKHLLRLETRAKEERDREGYKIRPHSGNETTLWDSEAAWPGLD